LIKGFYSLGATDENSKSDEYEDRRGRMFSGIILQDERALISFPITVMPATLINFARKGTGFMNT
jgi:hypothetical protein